MKSETAIATTLANVAAALAASAATLATAASEMMRTEPTPVLSEKEETPTPVATEKKRMGRPPGSKNKPAAEETSVAAETETIKVEVAPHLTVDDLRALIEPLVKAARGDEVKKVITKYAPRLSEIEPKDHAAFVKDIEALSM